MEREKAEAKAIADKLSSVQVTIRAKGSSGGKLFGAVTSQEISDCLKAQHGIEIDIMECRQVHHNADGST